MESRCKIWEARVWSRRVVLIALEFEITGKLRLWRDPVAPLLDSIECRSIACLLGMMFVVSARFSSSAVGRPLFWLSIFVQALADSYLPWILDSGYSRLVEICTTEASRPVWFSWRSSKLFRSTYAGLTFSMWVLVELKSGNTSVVCTAWCLKVRVASLLSMLPNYFTWAANLTLVDWDC